MKDIDYMEWLRRHDESKGVLFPADFNRDKAIAQGLTLAKDLEARLKAKAIIDLGQLHDTAYHTEITFPEMGQGRSWITIRLSNFGDMVTIINSEKIDEERLRLILEALANLNYRYLPERVLAEPYAGRLSHLSTWMQRFFHYH